MRTPSVQSTSLMASGMPASGPSVWPSRAARSMRSASRQRRLVGDGDEGPTLPSTWSMRSRWARVSSTAEISRRASVSPPRRCSIATSQPHDTPYLVESEFRSGLFVFQHRAYPEITILLRWRIGEQRCGWIRGRATSAAVTSMAGRR